MNVAAAGWIRGGGLGEVFVTVLKNVDGVDSAIAVHLQFEGGYAVFSRCPHDDKAMAVNNFLADLQERTRREVEKGADDATERG